MSDVRRGRSSADLMVSTGLDRLATVPPVRGPLYCAIHSFNPAAPVAGEVPWKQNMIKSPVIVLRASSQEKYKNRI